MNLDHDLVSRLPEGANVVASPTVVRRSDGSPLENVRSLSAALSSVCAGSADGKAFCWGSNQGGQLGAGDTTGRATATRVQAVASVSGAAATLSGVADVHMGGGSACAIMADGHAMCWGLNAYGQLGIAPPDFRPSYTWRSDATRHPAAELVKRRFSPIPYLNDVTSIASSENATCWLAGIDPYCAGLDRYGSLGDGPVSSTQAVSDERDGAVEEYATPVRFERYSGLDLAWQPKQLVGS